MIINDLKTGTGHWYSMADATKPIPGLSLFNVWEVDEEEEEQSP